MPLDYIDPLGAMKDKERCAMETPRYYDCYGRRLGADDPRYIAAFVHADDYDALAAERDLIVIRAENAERALEQVEGKLAEAETRIRNAFDALADGDEAGAHLILYEWARTAQENERG